MKNLDELKKQYEKLGQEIERLDGGVDWYPKRNETVYVVGASGIVCEYEFEGFERKCIENHTCFQNESQAQKAARLMKRSNAIIRACILVDPDYEPNLSDSEEKKWSVFYDNKINKWCPAYTTFQLYTIAYVSTLEKAQQVCELLTKWGVK